MAESVRRRLPSVDWKRVAPIAYTVGGFVLVLVLGWLDYLTGPVFGFTVFYLFPVAIVTWFGGKGASAAAAAASALARYVADGLAAAELMPGYHVWNAFAELGVFLAVAYVLLRLRAVHGHQTEVARLDSLTGLPNVAGFLDAAEREVVRAQRYARPLTMAYLDLDDFRRVNRRRGHKVGDELLKAIATAIRISLRSTDIIARTGGDEFAILLPETPNPAALEVLVRLRSRVLDRAKRNGTGVTASIGAATFMIPPVDAEDMIHKACELMDEAKSAGKDTIRHSVFEGDKLAQSAELKARRPPGQEPQGDGEQAAEST